MGIHLTPLILESAYRFLQNTPPFNRWKLPHADHVSFRVMKTQDFYGAHYYDGKTPVIEVSGAMVSHASTLIEVMAHEMVHLKQAEKPGQPKHGVDFKRYASQVCKYHGFDPKSF